MSGKTCASSNPAGLKADQKGVPGCTQEGSAAIAVYDITHVALRRACREISARMLNAQARAVSHVKTHGALNNMANDDIEYALAVRQGIKAADPQI